MKTAISLLKVIGFVLLVAWLVSCGNAKKARTAEEIKHVKFDLELLGGEISHLDHQMNSFRFVDDMAYATNNLSQTQLRQKRAKAKQAEQEYLELSRTRTRVQIKMIMLKVKYDSLKTELAKY